MNGDVVRLVALLLTEPAMERPPVDAELAGGSLLVASRLREHPPCISDLEICNRPLLLDGTIEEILLARAAERPLQVFGRDDLSVAKVDRSLDGIGELSHIARPSIRAQESLGGARKLSHSSAHPT